jgi:glycosyltransferase involved in cell wall biosynthesis
MNQLSPTRVKPHIAICICTFKRPQLLAQLLRELADQRTDGLFDYSISIVDNDASDSAREIVARAGAESRVPISYEVEQEQNIALARNKAVKNSAGDFVAFIDDDEVPNNDWLFRLYQACCSYRADGVLGPVKPRFSKAPPAWTVKAGIFERPNSQDYPSGTVLHWEQTGMGNVLVKRSVLDSVDGPFGKQFGSGGEDIDFFRRAIQAGKVFTWCADAMIYETVPAERTGVTFQLKRALLRGKASLASPAGRPLGVLKSISAVGLYAIFLPVSLLLGRHVFLKNLIKSCDHLGKILAALGINVVGEKYVVN